MDNSQAEREARLLAEGREKVLARVMKAEKAGAVGSLPHTNYLVRQALDELVAQIKVDSDRKCRARPGAYKKFALYLASLDPEIAALRAIQAVLEVLFKTGGADVPVDAWQKAARAAGKAVYTEYLMRHFKELSPPLFNSLVREYDKNMTTDEGHRLKAFKMKFDGEGYEYPTWEFGDIEHVGNYILTELVRCQFLDSYNRTERRMGKVKVVKYISLVPELRSASLHIVDMAAAMPRVAGPLIEPPLDWDYKTNSGGGYHTVEMQRLLAYAVQGNGLCEVAKLPVESMNALQRQEWTINREVFKVVAEVSRTRDFGDVVTADPGPKPEFSEDLTDEQKKEWKVAARDWYSDKKVRAAKSRSLVKVLAEAVELQQHDKFWFAYFADFRGRKYARAFGVSPQGNDLEKGLIQFAQGRPINTPEAERWFRIHGANKYGLDKETLHDREVWSHQNHDLIMRIGTDPTGDLSWTEADSPVQFLAWCIEYSRWHQGKLVFRSHIPLGQDGTCNGLQNFSALMRDEVGGRAVNLVPGERPQDIYNDVAKAVLVLLGQAPPEPHRDAWLAHGINRKVTKRTTMTLPYGCTRYACSEFIVADYLQAVKPPEIPKADYGAAGNYLSHHIWSALDTVVVKAREVMLWLQGWAKHSIKAGVRVQWWAPNGLLVRSEYRKSKSRIIKSAAFRTRFNVYEAEDGVVSLVKSSNSVAPNFVHSLDASHMDRVIVRAIAAGMCIVTIHDDFGVHAVDTDRFNQIVREEFVAMYEGSTILEDMARASEYEVPIPTKGTLDLQLVLKSPYFFA